jgi:hypothetical protein
MKLVAPTSRVHFVIDLRFRLSYMMTGKSVSVMIQCMLGVLLTELDIAIITILVEMERIFFV